METAMTAQQHSGRGGEAVEENDVLQRFADRYDIGLNHAKNLVARFGNDRATLDREAVELKGKRR